MENAERNRDEQDKAGSDLALTEAVGPTVPDGESSEGVDEKPKRSDEPFTLQNTAYSSESIDETVRRSGLAWSAGIVFFSSIVFMLFLGWIADILLGSAPWGLVGGIVLGSVIGFIQFFRISSQIFKKNEPPASPRTLFRDNDDNE